MARQKALCILCCWGFSIGHGGEIDLTQHVGPTAKMESGFFGDLLLADLEQVVAAPQRESVNVDKPSMEAQGKCIKNTVPDAMKSTGEKRAAELVFPLGFRALRIVSFVLGSARAQIPSLGGFSLWRLANEKDSRDRFNRNEVIPRWMKSLIIPVGTWMFVMNIVEIQPKAVVGE